MNTKKVLQFSIGPIGSALLALITLPIVAWYFPIEAVGRLAMLQVAISFSILLFTLGLDQAYVREYHEVDCKSALLRTVLMPGFVVLSVFLVLFLFLPWSLSGLLFGIESFLLTLVLICSIFFAFFSRFLSLILRMQERGLAFSISQILPKFMFLVILGLYIWLSVDAIFENLILANLFSLFVVLAILLWNSRLDLILAAKAKYDIKNLKMMIKYAAPLVGGGLAFWGLISMDRFFLRAYSNFEEVGIYSIAVSFAGAALVFQSIFTTIWVPVIYKWASEENGVDPKKIQNVVDYLMFAIIVVWSFAGMFSWLINYVLPPEYNQVQYIFLATMAYPLLYTLSEATGVGIGIKRKTMYSLLAAILALVVNAIGNWILIPDLGASGAAIASALAFSIFFIVRTEVSSKIWVPVFRKKIYLFLLFFVVISIAINLKKFYSWDISLIYFLFFIFGFWVYKDLVTKIVRNRFILNLK